MNAKKRQNGKTPSTELLGKTTDTDSNSKQKDEEQHFADEMFFFRSGFDRLAPVRHTKFIVQPIEKLKYTDAIR